MKRQAAVYSIIVFLVLVGLGCSSPTATDEVISDDYSVMSNGKIVAATGFGLGVDDSQHLCNWVQQDSTSMVLHYPGDLGWGAVFITVGGDPKNPPRPSIDISNCTRLSIEMKSAVDSEGVLIGMKDEDDPDDGTEIKKPVYLTQDWKTYEFMLSDFRTCDLTKVYVVAEFVFPCDVSNRAVTVDVKNISILR